MSTSVNDNESPQNDANEPTQPVIAEEGEKDIVKEENVVNNEEQIQTKEILIDTKEENKPVAQKVDEKETTKEETEVKEKDTTNEITKQPKECDGIIQENKVNTTEEEVKESNCNTDIHNSEIKENNQQMDNLTNNDEQIIKTENILEAPKDQTLIEKIDTTSHNEQQQENIDDDIHNQHEQNKQDDTFEQQHTQQENNTIPNETGSKQELPQQEPPQQEHQQEEEHQQQPSTNPHLDSLTETYKTLHNTFPPTARPLLSPLLSLLTSQLTTYSTLTSLSTSSPEYHSLLLSNLTSLSSSLSTLLPSFQQPTLSPSSPISFTIPLSNPKPQVKKRQGFSKAASSNYQTNPSTTKYSKQSTRTTKLNRSSDSFTSPTKQQPSKQTAPSSVQTKPNTRIHNNSTITSSSPSNKNNNTLSAIHNIKSQNSSSTKHVRSASMKVPNTDKLDTYTQGNSNSNNNTSKEQSVFLSAIHVNRPSKQIKKGVPEYCKKHQKVFNKSNSAKKITYSSSARTSAGPKLKETATPVTGKTVLPDKNILDYASVHEKTEKEFENIGAKPSSYAKYLVKKYKDVVQNYHQVDEDEQKTSGKKINKKETNSNHSINGSNIDLYDYLKRNKQKFKHYKYNFLYEGEDAKKVAATTENTNLNTIDNTKAMSKIQVLKKK